jgi:hypothetical protein
MAAAPWRLRAPARRVAARFADVVCPPEIRTERRTDSVLAEFEQLLGVQRPYVRRAVSAGFIVLDRAARLHPRCRGRRFVRLTDETAESYVRMLLTGRGTVASLARRLKGLLVLCYYELPQVKNEIGFLPDPYIAMVSQRRLRLYAADIQAGEAAVSAVEAAEP